ncbi:MAG: hypothetical protein NXI10_11855 [bacterium]|nr:hypothetical protein [bacterium]
MDIKLTFVNTVEDYHGNVVFFQKNAESFSGEATAWKILKGTNNGWGVPFDFPTGFQVAVQNADGAPTPQLTAELGDKFIVEMDAGSMKLSAAGKASNPKCIEILNDLPNQSITALIYKDEDLLAKLENGAPSQTASFEFNEKLWVGVCGDEFQQGQTMKRETVEAINTELNLFAITSADIVMKKHDSGKSDADVYTFELENVVNK